MPDALYNEIDPYAVEWLRALISAGHIAPGVVDARPIQSLSAADVAGDGQRHFFAGIAGWSYALRLAGWPDDLPVWTGSCPCQPFSAAGRRKGFSDERHLWPIWFNLIRECRPAVVVGEQVASPDGLKWLDTVSSDLEAEGYAFGAADLCAAGVGAPHIRQRLYFVAVTGGEGRQQIRAHLARGGSRSGAPGVEQRLVHGCDVLVAHPDDARPQGRGFGRHGADQRVAGADGVADAERDDRPRRIDQPHGRSTIEPDRHGTTGGFWTPCDWIPCRDGKARSVEPGTFPLAHGVSARVGRLRGYGNAIVPQVAATFIRAVAGALL